jgi:hypothetical protein
LNYFIYAYLIGVVALTFLPLVRGGAPLTPPALFGLVGLVLWFLLIRDPIAATDGYNYSQLYLAIVNFEDIFQTYHGNYLFSFVQWCISLTGVSASDSVIVVSIIIWAITVAGFCLITWGRPRWLLLSLGLFSLTSTFILLYFNALRQGLALAVLFVAIGLFVRKKNWAGGIASILCIFAHTSGLLASFVIVLASVKAVRRAALSNYGISLIFGIAVTAAIFVKIGFPLLWSSIGSDLGADAFPRYSLLGVLGKIYDLQLHEAGNELVLAKITLAVILALFFRHTLRWTDERDYEKPVEYLVTIYIFLTAISIMLFGFLEISGRLIYYASALTPLLLAHLFFVPIPKCGATLKGAIYIACSLSYGLIVILYPATARQIGI